MVKAGDWNRPNGVVRRKRQKDSVYCFRPTPLLMILTECFKFILCHKRIQFILITLAPYPPSSLSYSSVTTSFYRFLCHTLVFFLCELTFCYCCLLLFKWTRKLNLCRDCFETNKNGNMLIHRAALLTVPLYFYIKSNIWNVVIVTK